VTSGPSIKGNPVIMGHANPSYTNSELFNYVELLSASNFSFDISNPEEISFDTFISRDTIKYAVVIFTFPLSYLSASILTIIREVSHELGISMIASYTYADKRSKSFFGIRDFRGKKPLWPLKVKIIRWPGDLHEGEVIANYGLISGLPGIRKRGLRKLSIKNTFIKGMRVLKELILPYVRVELQSDAHILATSMKGEPLVWAYQFGKAINYYFALNGDLFLDKFNEMHRLVRAAIEANSGFGMASVDLENSMVLRLDDPGACSADYLNNGGILKEDDWKDLGKVLEGKRIPISVMYTPGWVDDGDARTGRLYIDNQEVLERKAGNIYDSAQVKYIRLDNKNGEYDHSSEFRGLTKLVEGKHIDIHSHGLTHLDPDHESWSNAKDKNRDTQWYHEFFHVKSGEIVDENDQRQSMVSSRDKINNLFGTIPCALTPPGHRHDMNCDMLAREAGYRIFSADYTAVLKSNILVRNWKIPSVFLYLKDPTPFASRSGYPFIGVVHDYEIKKGLRKFEDIIEKWKASSINRFITMRDLTASLCVSMDVYYLRTESKMSFIITLPKYSGMDRAIPEFMGSQLLLRIVLPEKMELINNSLSISGAKLISVQRLGGNGTLGILLRIKNESTITISLPTHFLK